MTREKRTRAEILNKEPEFHWGDPAKVNWRKLLWTFPLHQVASTFGVLFLANALTNSVFSAPTARWILTEVPYFPAPVALAFINGVFLQRRFGHRVMQWVWVLPFLILCMPYTFEPRVYPLSERFARPLGGPCEPTLHCGSLRVLEAAFCTALAYSIGAILTTKRTAPRIIDLGAFRPTAQNLRPPSESDHP